jgi:hypothetical protein
MVPQDSHYLAPATSLRSCQQEVVSSCTLIHWSGSRYRIPAIGVGECSDKLTSSDIKSACIACYQQSEVITEVVQGGHALLQGFAGLSAAGMEPGYDKVNQDYICIQPIDSGDTSVEARGKSYMFAVLDGHGAEGASLPVCEKLVQKQPFIATCTWTCADVTLSACTCVVPGAGSSIEGKQVASCSDNA